MKCSLCGLPVATSLERCIRCGKACAGGQALERERGALLAEHCTHSCVTKGHCDALHAAHNELAAQIRARGKAPAHDG